MPNVRLDREYEVEIHHMRDRHTGRSALMFVDKDGGYRLTSGKDTGDWEFIKKFDCTFDHRQLEVYDKRSEFAQRNLERAQKRVKSKS